MRFRAADPSVLATETLDAFVAVYHRPSGMTHLLAEPAPQILAALVEPRTLDALADLLAGEFDLSGEPGALAARVDELVAAGLVEAA